jgi:hypothetical protein
MDDVRDWMQRDVLLAAAKGTTRAVERTAPGGAQNRGHGEALFCGRRLLPLLGLMGSGCCCSLLGRCVV